MDCNQNYGDGDASGGDFHDDNQDDDIENNNDENTGGGNTFEDCRGEMYF